MSVEAMAVVLHHSMSAKTDKLILLGIANHEGDGGAWPSVKTLAKYARCSERQAQRAIRSLIELGELEVAAQRGGNGETRSDRRPNLYRVKVSCPPDCDGSTQHRSRGDMHDTPRVDGVTSTTQRGDIHVVDGVTPMSPEPSLEPSKNRKERSRPVPDGWQPAEHLRSELAAKYPTLNIGQEAEKFVEWHGAKGSKFVDHAKAFRLWCRNAVKYQAEKPAKKPDHPGWGGVAPY